MPPLIKRRNEMSFKTFMGDERELVITNVHTIKEEDGLLTFFPPNHEKCVIYVNGKVLIMSDTPTIDIRCTVGGMTILR